MLSDSEFFLQDLNPEIPELAGMRRMAEAGDYAGARRGFAAYLRKVLPARKALYRSVPYEEPENIYKLPGESDEEACRRVCAHTLVSVGTPMAFGEKGDVDWTANPTKNGYREWTWQLNRHNDVKMLARQYALTRDRKLAACAQELLGSWMKTAPCPPESVPGTETKCWRTIECGIRMGANWPYIFFALCDTFSDDFLRVVLHVICI